MVKIRVTIDSEKFFYSVPASNGKVSSSKRNMFEALKAARAAKDKLQACYPFIPLTITFGRLSAKRPYLIVTSHYEDY